MSLADLTVLLPPPMLTWKMWVIGLSIEFVDPLSLYKSHFLSLELLFPSVHLIMDI